MRKSIATSLCVITLLSVSFAPLSARAGTDEGNPVRLYATAERGPIGRIEHGLPGSDSLTINGHRARPGQAVWSGDLIQSDVNSRVFVWLDLIGQVTLARETVVRLAAGHRSIGEGARGLTLIATLSRGEVAIKLEPAASAYLSVANSEYTSSDGADFVASAREGRGSMKVKRGEVRVERQSAQPQYTIRPVGHGSNIRVPGGGLRRLQMQVLEDEKPVPGVGVVFALDTSAAVVGVLGMGTLSGASANVITDADGMAAVEFVARNVAGSSPISAVVEGTRVAWTGTITVTDGGGISRATGWTIFGLAAAGAAAGIVYGLTRDNDPLRAQPPIVKSP